MRKCGKASKKVKHPTHHLLHVITSDSSKYTSIQAFWHISQYHQPCATPPLGRGCHSARAQLAGAENPAADVRANRPEIKTRERPPTVLWSVSFLGLLSSPPVNCLLTLACDSPARCSCWANSHILGAAANLPYTWAFQAVIRRFDDLTLGFNL